MFHILERETQWRRENGLPEGFGAMRASRPIVAVGAKDPLEDQKMLADYFRTSWPSIFLFPSQTHYVLTTPQMAPMDSEVSMLAYVQMQPHICPRKRMKCTDFYHIVPTSHPKP